VHGVFPPYSPSDPLSIDLYVPQKGFVLLFKSLMIFGHGGLTMTK
jgi:hypothetical protein